MKAHTIIARLILYLAIISSPLHGEDTIKIEPAWTDPADGWIFKGEYIDLDIATRDRLFIRYSALSDSGAQLERIRGDVVLWRRHVQPLGVIHSGYRHHVQVRVWRDIVYIESHGDSGYIYETRNLKDGSLINREIRDPSKPQGSFFYQKETDLSNERTDKVEHPGAGQPATKPADSTPTEVQPIPTSKNGPK